ncbi:MAG: organic hydroperoxide resistance protein [Alphaproteobacteria bacterium]|nr:organic hydroperoxide resistance protein [Alphaproteobacteria bacterium]
MKTLYTAHATATGGREGRAETNDGQLSVTLSRPGGNKPGTNPEQLFACGYAACFGGALDFIAKQQHVKLNEVKVASEVALNQDDGGFFISAVLNVSLPGLDRAGAEKLVRAAHQMCPYSKATRNNIKVELKVNDQPLALAA